MKFDGYLALIDGQLRDAAEFFRYFAEFARRIEGEILP